MLKAFLLKISFFLAGLAGVFLWPAYAVWWGCFCLSTMALFFTYLLTHPATSFFVPTVSRGKKSSLARPSLALTFDDGPHPEFTPKVLELLRRYDAKASFFVVGTLARKYPRLLLRMHEEGHVVGVHTEHHSLQFHFGPFSYTENEIQKSVDSVFCILHRTPRFFRPPQGLRTPILAHVWPKFSWMKCITWTARGRDATSASTKEIVSRLSPSLTSGAILTLHDGTGFLGSLDRTATLQALEELLISMREKRISAVTLETLLAEEAYVTPIH